MNNITEKIKSGQIRMRPRIVFVLKSILLVALSLMLFLLLLFLVSFILLFINPAGFFVFFPRFPWLLLLVSLIFVVLLEYIIEHYAVAYRRPIVYSLLAILFLVFACSVAMNGVHFHDRIEKRKLPGVYKFYNNFKGPHMECPGGCPLNEIKIRRKLY